MLMYPSVAKGFTQVVNEGLIKNPGPRSPLYEPNSKQSSLLGITVQHCKSLRRRRRPRIGARPASARSPQARRRRRRSLPLPTRRSCASHLAAEMSGSSMIDSSLGRGGLSYVNEMPRC